MRVWRHVVIFVALLGLVASGRAGTLVQFHIFIGVNYYAGDIEAELYDQDKPTTVQNFLKYVTGGYYRNDFFHRCVPGFVLQGGGFTTATATSTNLFQSWNDVPPVFGPITNEFFSGTRRSNTYGTLAMARGTNLNSATSQFFFNLADNSAMLDSATNCYAVFGHVLRGTNLLNEFNGIFKNGGGIIDLTYFYGITADTLPLTDLPVEYLGLFPPRYEDLIYMIVTTVNLQAIKLTNSTLQLSWNSINGLTNNIEYATNLPPAWQALTNTIGNGGVMTATDTNKLAGPRFYRVHVLY